MDLTAALFDLCNSSKQPILAIDGPAGAGKTTLAEHLSAALSLKYTVAIIHMDDLYNGWDSAFDFHLKDALVSIVDAHRAKRENSLSRFDWHKNEFGAAEKLAPADLLILEGVGSSQSAIRQNLTACRRHPPPVANIEEESNVTACRDEDDKKKRFRQNQHTLKFH